MTNVLIPTDFTVQSLELVAQAAQQIPGKLNVFMFHAFDMPESLVDAINRSGLRSHHNLVTEDLRLKCRQVKMQYPDVTNISFKLMFGSSAVIFRGFAEANNIQVIVYPTGYCFVPPVRESVNPDRMFLKSGVTLIRDLSLKNKSQNSTPVATPELTARSGMALHRA